MRVKQLSNEFVSVHSTCGQRYATVEKKDARKWRVAFFHDSKELPLTVRYTATYQIALIHAKKFVNNPI